MTNSEASGEQTEKNGKEEDGIPLEQENEKAKTYNREKRRLFVIELAVGLLFLVLFFFSGASPAVARGVESASRNPWVVVLLYVAVTGALFELIGLPLDFYGSYVLEHKYGQSTQNLRGWAWDQVKGLLVNFVIGVSLVEVVYWLLRNYPNTWWAIGALLFVLFAVIMTVLAPVVLLPIFYKVIPLRDEELKRRILALSEKVGTRVEGVYEMDMSRKTRAANAALVGLGNTRRIILGDTLLERYRRDEIEVVLAHELGHHTHADIWKGLIFQSFIFFLGFYITYLVLNAFSNTFGLRGVADIAGFPLLVLVFSGVSLVFLPIINGFTRRLERSADDFALRVTRNPRAFISMMAKLGRQNLSEFEPSRLVEILLYSHPPISKRIRHAHEVFPESTGGGH
ncbi:MAG: M48 family peptidase [Candidatus Abyssobacteria bacterium SURF_5]|uniref:M48 family peptidase n=1 Tax=Abyssobacteria bacterium (strain SURF_5) TaxID=2093360 RepID=A0A3A4NL52_ABYX5|nr:MAG: M48 family peptidase [Candidatus Abyssubacteria bacterium SURF_5]